MSYEDTLSTRRLHMQICDLNTGKECGKQDRRRHGASPQKRQRSQDHRNRSPCPDNRRPLQGNRQGHPLQTNTYGQFHIIIQEQAFCGHISAQSGNRKVFIKYLNSNGVQCTALKELWDTEEIAGFIRRNLS